MSRSQFSQFPIGQKILMIIIDVKTTLVLTSRTTTHRLPSFSSKNSDSVTVEGACASLVSNHKESGSDRYLPHEGSWNSCARCRA